MNTKTENFISPIVKWVGGKRQLLPEIIPIIKDMNKANPVQTYVEPFIGGGAVLFALQPELAVINDYNTELVNMYRTIKRAPHALIKKLEEHAKYHSEYGSDYFYYIRAMDREDNYNQMSNVDKAARIIYLNKTCYNGLYRVNAAGQFNAPCGKYKNPDIVNRNKITQISTYFKQNNVSIMQGDYKKVLAKCKAGDLVYLDPPYMPISDSASFTGYTEGGFTFQQQKELRDQCVILNQKGVRFLLSNSYCDGILGLYSDQSIFTIKTVNAKRSINRDGNKRGEINEVLIYNGIK